MDTRASDSVILTFGRRADAVPDEIGGFENE